MRDIELKYWLAFARIEEIGASFIKKIYDYTNNIEEAWNLAPTELYEIANLPQKASTHFLRRRKEINPQECLEQIKKRDITVLTYADDMYPSLLKNISNPPMILFLKCDLKNCNLDKTLAIVGSRKASDNIKKVLEKIIGEFRNTDITIVSGGAAGIDTMAHQCSLKNGIKTIAVLGSGFDFYYPTQNKKLFEEIIEQNGVLISEFWPSFEAMPFRFPMRNRIVSGLCKGTLVAEAAIKSGALITANLCLEQGRELMCIPGLISNPNTQGIYKLLKQGATMVTSAEDILNSLNWQIQKNSQEKNKQNLPQKLNLSEDEQEVLDINSLDKSNIDKIISKTDLNIDDLMVILTSLELQGLIRQTDGENYSSLTGY